MSGKSALIIGATGATGKHLLRDLLASKDFTRVGEYGRRVTPAEQLGGTQAKLEQKVIDFERVQDAGLKEGKWDVVFITLGSTFASAGGSAAWERIDRGYVLDTGRAAKTDDPDHKQRIVYLSSSGANASSHFLYMRSKGLTENGLAQLGYSDTIVFRPGFLAAADRTRSDLIEKALTPLFKAASYISSSVQIEVSTLAKSMMQAGILGSSGLRPPANAYTAGDLDARFTVIGNKGALALGKSV